jgi:hypothetical protein
MANDLDLTAGFDAFALCCCEARLEKASWVDGTVEALLGEVVAMPIRSLLNPGVFFEPEVIALMSEAFEAACNVLRDARKHEVVREVIAGRIIAAASLGERDPVRLLLGFQVVRGRRSGQNFRGTCS